MPSKPKSQKKKNYHHKKGSKGKNSSGSGGAAAASPAGASAQPPIEEWTKREKLALACAVLKHGDQNWMSVARSIKGFVDPIHSHLPEFASQKHCAQQYNRLLESYDALNRRRRGDKDGPAEVPQLQIARKLTLERMEELRDKIAIKQVEYRKLTKDLEDLEAGLASPEFVDQLLKEAARKADPAIFKEKVHQPGSLLYGCTDEEIQSFYEDYFLKRDEPDEDSSDDEEEDEEEEEGAVAAAPKEKTPSPVKRSPSVQALPAAGTPIKLEPPTRPVVPGSPAAGVSPRAGLLPVKIEPKQEEERQDSQVAGDAQEPLAGARIKEEPGSSDKASDTTGFSQESLSPTKFKGSSDETTVESSQGNSTLGSTQTGGTDDSLRLSQGSHDVVPPHEDPSFLSELETTDDETSVTTTPKPGSSTMESYPGSPAPSTTESEIDEKAMKAWRKSIMLIWKAASVHKYANVFLHPVTEDIAPGYHSIVHRPMDMTTIKRNVENGIIKTSGEFQRDIMLMFTNALMYNNSNHDVFQMASEMYEEVMRHIEIQQHAIAQQLHPGEAAVTPVLKSLRASRRTDHSSDKEEEQKKRRASTEVESTSKKRK